MVYQIFNIVWFIEQTNYIIEGWYTEVAVAPFAQQPQVRVLAPIPRLGTSVEPR